MSTDFKFNFAEEPGGLEPLPLRDGPHRPRQADHAALLPQATQVRGADGAAQEDGGGAEGAHDQGAEGAVHEARVGLQGESEKGEKDAFESEFKKKDMKTQNKIIGAKGYLCLSQYLVEAFSPRFSVDLLIADYSEHVFILIRFRLRTEP